MSHTNISIRVSAIVPVYNVERYVRQCLDSLFSQTYPLEEIVLVDDGSTDSSGNICDEYAATYDRVVTVHKQNAGLGYARNTGLNSLSRPSDYVMFVDSDDWLEKDAVISLVSALGDNPADCVIGGHKKKTSEGKTLFEFRLENRCFVGSEVREMLLPRLCGSMPTAHDSLPMSVCSALYRRKMLEECKICFPSERELISEDFVFKFNVLAHSSRAILCDSVSYNYRTNMRSLSTSYRPDRFEASMHFFAFALDMIEDLQLSSDAITRMQKTLFIYLRKCISQELPKTSGKTTAQALSKLREIVSDKRVQSIVRAYPVSELALRQRVFIHLIRNRCATVLYCAARCGKL